jgi:hypothetical protein
MAPSVIRNVRRVLGALVALAAIALVMVKTRGPTEPSSGAVGLIAAAGFVVSLVLFILVWRKEHAANEAAFAERERAQLALMRLQIDLAKKKKPAGGESAPD